MALTATADPYLAGLGRAALDDAQRKLRGALTDLQNAGQLDPTVASEVASVASDVDDARRRLAELRQR